MGPLCGPGWIHFYDDPLLAVFLNPVHADFSNPRLWECEVSGEIRNDRGLKFGAQTLTTLWEITPVPEVTLEQRIRFAIFCALEVCKDPGFVRWADRWLDSSDRSSESARAAESAAVSLAAQHAARAAEAAAVSLAALAVRAAEWAARAAESAALAARVEAPIDMKAIARKAIQDESV
jgi:hypothetical protein